MSSTAQSPALSAVKRSLIDIVPPGLFDNGRPRPSTSCGVGLQSPYSALPFEILPASAAFVSPFASVNSISNLSWPLLRVSLCANRRHVGRRASTQSGGDTATPRALTRSDPESLAEPAK